MAKTLLNRGFDQKHERFQYALRWAACNGHVEEAQLLLNSGADIDYAPPDTRRNFNSHRGIATPVVIAANRDELRLVQCLLNNGADVQKLGYQSVHYALRSGFSDMVSFLINAGVGISQYKERYGCFPMTTAAVAGHDNVVQELSYYGQEKETSEDTEFATDIRKGTLTID